MVRGFFFSTPPLTNALPLPLDKRMIDQSEFQQRTAGTLLSADLRTVSQRYCFRRVGRGRREITKDSAGLWLVPGGPWARRGEGGFWNLETEGLCTVSLEAGGDLEGTGSWGSIAAGAGGPGTLPLSPPPLLRTPRQTESGAGKHGSPCWQKTFKELSGV